MEWGVGFAVFMILVGGIVIFHILRILGLLIPIFYWGFKTLCAKKR